MGTNNSACGLVHYTPTDSSYITDINGVKRAAKGFLLGTDGALKVTWGNGRTETVPIGVFNTGEIHWVEVDKIWNEGTNAQNIYIAVDFKV